MKISDMTQAQQIEHLVSKRDRMISIYRQTGNPAYKDGRELIATVTVSTDANGDISIGLGETSAGRHQPSDIEVEFIDDEEHSDSARWCPHGWAKLQPEGISLCPDCSGQSSDTRP